MDATRRLASGLRWHRAAPRLPVLLLLRSAIGLLALLALAAGAITSDPPARSGAARLEEQAATPEKPTPGTRHPAPPSRHRREVFVCDDAGTPVFSDRPCGPDLIRRSVSVEQPIAGQVASTLAPAPSASTRPRARPVDRREVAHDADARCTTLRRQLEQVDDRLRSGYSSREAARLWERRRDLKDELRAGRC